MVASVAQDLFRRRVPQALAAYLAVCWGVIEAVDWLVERYALSPHLVDLVLVALLSMLPTVVLLAFFHGAAGQQAWTKAEIIGIPANVFLSASLLYVLFWGRGVAAGAADTELPPTSRQISFEGKVADSAISPDGQYFAYVSGRALGHQELKVRDIAGGQAVVVFDGSIITNLRWSPDGSELVFNAGRGDSSWTYVIPRLGGTARRVSWGDVSDWAPDGTRVASIWTGSKQLRIVDTSSDESTPIEPVGSFEWLLDLAWSPAGDVITYLTLSEDRAAIWATTADGREQHKVVDDTTLSLGSPRWSPAGDAIYFLRSGGVWRIRVSPDAGMPEGAPVVVLPQLELYEGMTYAGRSFSISANGKQLLYTRQMAHSNLWLATVAAFGDPRQTETKELTTGSAKVGWPSVSPDGMWVAFTMEQPDGNNVFIMPVEGGRIRQITFTEAAVRMPVWSPDGLSIAFGAPVGGGYRVWSIDISGGSARQFTSTDLSSDQNLTWSPGSQILYQRPGNQNFNLLDPVTGQERPLVDNDSVGWMFVPRYSPDGERVAVFWNRPPNSGLWLISLQDGSQEILLEGGIAPIDWSADGAWIYAMQWGQSAVLKVPASGGRPDTVVTLPFADVDPWQVTISPGGERLVAAVPESISDVWLVENFDPYER